jgi:hypothetical protein
VTSVEGLGCLLEFILTPVLELLLWLVLLPICLILATPGMLVLAFFGEGSYLAKAGQGYQRVVRFWKRLTKLV